MSLKVPLKLFNIARSAYALDIGLYALGSNPPFYIDEDTGYIVQALRHTQVDIYPIVISLHGFGPGTYEWRVKIENPAPNKTFWVGFGELFAGNSYDSIMIYRIGAVTTFETKVTGSSTATDISASIDLTSSTTLKLVWVSGTSAALYVDGGLVATHTTNIPAVLLHTFIEIMHSATQSTHSYIYAHPELFNGSAKR